MAVYRRTYQGYSGPLTPPRRRWMVITRQALAGLLESRFMLLFLAGCLVWPGICAALIYLRHNSGALELLRLSLDKLIPIDGSFFYRFMDVQGVLAFLLAALAAPGLISPDLTNNAMPLYLARPLSRGEYVTGKMAVLAILLSAITWIPGLLLFGLQAGLEGGQWLRENLWIAWGLAAGSWVWILTLSLLGLALSAWVKWRVLAGALLLGIFFAAAGFGQAVNQALDTRLGDLINLGRVVQRVWAGLFRQGELDAVAAQSAWLVLVAVWALSLRLLAAKVRACEVERS